MDEIEVLSLGSASEPEENAGEDILSGWLDHAAVLTVDRGGQHANDSDPAKCTAAAQEESVHIQRFETIADDTFVKLCIRNFIHRGLPMMHIIHPFSLRIGEQSVSYYAAAVMGGLTHISESVRMRSKAVFGKIWSEIKQFLGRSTISNVDQVFSYIQASVMAQVCALLLGDDQYMSDITEMYQLMIKSAQNIDLFATSTTTKIRMPHLGQIRDEEWQEWIQLEERKRTIITIYMLDAELSTIHQTVPTMNHARVNIPEAASDELFLCDTSQGWNELRSNSKQSHVFCWNLIARLLTLNAAIVEARILKSLDDHRMARLTKAIEDLYDEETMSTPIGDTTIDIYKMLWHASFISLYASFDRLKKILGHGLAELLNEDETHLSDWAGSSDCLRSVLHAMAVKSIAERQPFARKTAFFLPRILLQTVVIVLVVIKYGIIDVNTVARSTTGELLFPELEMAGIDPMLSLFDLEVSSSTGKPMDALYNSALHTLANVIARQGLWDISKIFASRLHDLLATQHLSSVHTDFLSLTHEFSEHDPASSLPQTFIGGRENNMNGENSAIIRKRKSERMNEKREEHILERPIRLQLDQDHSSISNMPSSEFQSRYEFPSCTNCFNARVQCIYDWGKSCERCIAQGSRCKKRIRAKFNAQELPIGIRKAIKKNRKCRKCFMTGLDCYRSFGSNRPCDNCWASNNYCYSNLKGVRLTHDRRTAPDIWPVSDIGADDEVSGNEEPDDGFPDETIVLHRSFGDDDDNNIENTKPCATCYYYRRKCLQERGASKCKLCVAKKRVCHFNINLYCRPYIDRRRNNNSAVPRPQPMSLEVTMNVSSGNKSSSSEFGDEESKRGPPFPVRPCRRCYYDGRNCHRSRGENAPCDKCTRVGQRCNPDLTGIKPYQKNQKRPRKRLKKQRFSNMAGSMVKVQAPETANNPNPPPSPTQKLRDNPNADPLVVFAAWLPKNALRPNPESRPCRRCFNESHFCYRSQGRENPCDTCSGRSTCYSDLTGIVPQRYRKSLQAQTLHGRSHAGIRKPTELTEVASRSSELEKTYASPTHVSIDPLVIYKDWLPGESRARLSSPWSIQDRPCRKCFVDGIHCYMRSDSTVCNRCISIGIACNKDLSDAQPRKYRKAHSDGGSPGGQDHSPDQQSAESSSGIDQDWSTDSGDASDGDGNDIGQIALRFYLENPPRSRWPDFQQKMPCRRCLQTRVSCDMLPDGLGKCRICAYGRNTKNCNPNLYGAKPYPGKYPELSRDSGLPPSMVRADSALDQNFLAAYESTDSEAVDEGTSTTKIEEQFQDRNDSGLLLLREYLKNPPRPRQGVDESRVRRIPCRRCLISRRACYYYYSEASEVCTNCQTSGKHICNLDLRGVTPNERAWKVALRAAGHRTATRARLIRPVSSESESESGGSTYEHSSQPTRSSELEEIVRVKLFGNSKNDPGLILLRDYMRRPPGSSTELPCRRCLRMRLTCIRSKGLSSGCEQCARHGSPCRSELKGALPYPKRYNNLSSEEKVYLERYADTNFDILNLEVCEISESEGDDPASQDRDLLAMFDYDPTDPGYQTLKEYLSNPPQTTKPTAPEGYRQAKIPCRSCLLIRIVCWVNDETNVCRRCQGRSALKICDRNLKAVVLPPSLLAIRAKRKTKLANKSLQPQSIDDEAIPVVELSDSDNNAEEYSSMSYSDKEIPQEEAQRVRLTDFTRAELLATVDGDENDIGFKTLQAYLTVPPRTKVPDTLWNGLPCRVCLNQHSACIKSTENPMLCNKCASMRMRQCNFSLKGARPGPGKWGAHMMEAMARF